MQLQGHELRKIKSGANFETKRLLAFCGGPIRGIAPQRQSYASKSSLHTSEPDSTMPAQRNPKHFLG